MRHRRTRINTSDRPVLLPSQVATQTGVSTDTLRHYERKGILPPPRRTSGGYRQYDDQTLARVLLVRRALRFGFTLDELAQLFRARDRAERGLGEPPCQTVRDLASAKLQDVEERLRELNALRDDLEALLASWDGRLAENEDGGLARLLETLPDRQSTPPHPPMVRKEEES